MDDHRRHEGGDDDGEENIFLEGAVSTLEAPNSSLRLALRSCAGFIESKAKVGAASNPLCRRAAAASLRILSEDGVEDGVAGACLNLLSILSNNGLGAEVLSAGLDTAVRGAVRWATTRLSAAFVEDVYPALRSFCLAADLAKQLAQKGPFADAPDIPSCLAIGLAAVHSACKSSDGASSPCSAAMWELGCECGDSVCNTLLAIAEFGSLPPAMAVEAGAIAFDMHVQSVGRALSSGIVERPSTEASKLRHALEQPLRLMSLMSQGHSEVPKFGERREATAVNLVAAALESFVEVLGLLRSASLHARDLRLKLRGFAEVPEDPPTGSIVAWGRLFAAELMGILFRGSAVDSSAAARLHSLLRSPLASSFPLSEDAEAFQVQVGESSTLGAGAGLFVRGHAPAGTFCALYPGEWRSKGAASTWWDRLPADSVSASYTAAFRDQAMIDGSPVAAARATRAALSAMHQSSSSRAPEYSLKKYWSSRYLANKQPYDWLWNYADIKLSLNAVIQDKTSHVLHLGCGNSPLAFDMYNDGFTLQTNIDFCPEVIQQMSLLHPMMEWKVADAKDLPFADSTFEYVVEKCMVDTLFCGNTEESSVIRMFREAYRVLKPGGMYLGWSLHSIEDISKLAEALDWGFTAVAVSNAKSRDQDSNTLFVCRKRALPDVPVSTMPVLIGDATGVDEAQSRRNDDTTESGVILDHLESSWCLGNLVNHPASGCLPNCVFYEFSSDLLHAGGSEENCRCCGENCFLDWLPVRSMGGKRQSFLALVTLRSCTDEELFVDYGFSGVSNQIPAWYSIPWVKAFGGTGPGAEKSFTIPIEANSRKRGYVHFSQLKFATSE